ncbi:hypothetical protein P691DRAFT_791671 [Macrolepiota fuliginosa MF-IS2]|uniref:Uncharacterized protein n=1 Tax=Macrolepiota fuliginosa MF-IS2 TaxID=1400762 RepID=A0A9P5XCW4_9AGAR|nr:hypothetical protein P691DRAFT_791671 [Macrolepiota fuliginosa MF-IS2]
MANGTTTPPPSAELDAFYTLIMQRILPGALCTILLLCAMLYSNGSYAGNDESVALQLTSPVLAISTAVPICNSSSFGGVVEACTLRTWRLNPFYGLLVVLMRSGDFCAPSPTVHNAFFELSLEFLLKYEEGHCFRGSGVYDQLSGRCHSELGGLPEVAPQLLRRFGRVDFRKCLQNRNASVEAVIAIANSSVGSTSGFPQMNFEDDRGMEREWDYTALPPQLRFPVKVALPREVSGQTYLRTISHGAWSQASFELGCYQEFTAVKISEGKGIYREQFNLCLYNLYVDDRRPISTPSQLAIHFMSQTHLQRKRREKISLGPNSAPEARPQRKRRKKQMKENAKKWGKATKKLYEEWVMEDN